MTINKHGCSWSYSRALGKKYIQIENITQGSPSAIGVATAVAQVPEHVRNEEKKAEGSVGLDTSTFDLSVAEGDVRTTAERLLVLDTRWIDDIDK